MVTVAPLVAIAPLPSGPRYAIGCGGTVISPVRNAVSVYTSVVREAPPRASVRGGATATISNSPASAPKPGPSTVVAPS